MVEYRELYGPDSGYYDGSLSDAWLLKFSETEYGIITREMYMDYLSTVENDYCFSSGPLSTENAY